MVRGFQSTPPAWGATLIGSAVAEAWACFNPRPPRGGRPCKLKNNRHRFVSIHAPRVGGDFSFAFLISAPPGFNPRPPRGGRPHRARSPRQTKQFQSTPPAWGATGKLLGYGVSAMFQSTPPAWGATRALHDEVCEGIRFNPRPPRGGRHADGHQYGYCDGVSIHAPRVGGDTGDALMPLPLSSVSIHAPRVGGDKWSLWQIPAPYAFQSTPPAWGATIKFDYIDAFTSFQSTPPAWGATSMALRTTSATSGFNPRPPRGGRP